MNRLMSIKEVAHQMGCSHVTIYRQVEVGTMIQPIRMGNRVLFPDSEVGPIVDARIKGFTDEQIKQLVIELIEKRGEL